MSRVDVSPDRVKTDDPTSWALAVKLEDRLLAAILGDSSTYFRIRELVDGGDFSTALGSRLFDAMARLIAAGRPLERWALWEFAGIYEWDQRGGAEAYLEKLSETGKPAEEAETIARRIRAGAQSRRLGMKEYDRDILGWTHRQAELLAALAERPDEISRQVDWENVIEEILSVGRSQVKGVVRKMELLLAHLMKTASSPDAPSMRGWRSEIALWRSTIKADFTPAMKRVIDIEKVWRTAREEAAVALDDYGERLARSIPATCPFALDDLLDEDRTADDLARQMVGPAANHRASDTPD